MNIFLLLSNFIISFEGIIQNQKKDKINGNFCLSQKNVVFFV